MAAEACDLPFRRAGVAIATDILPQKSGAVYPAKPSRLLRGIAGSTVLVVDDERAWRSSGN